MSEKITIEQFAKMSAEIAGGRPRASVLDAAGVSTAEWINAQQRWLGKMVEEGGNAASEITSTYKHRFAERKRELDEEKKKKAADAAKVAESAKTREAPAEVNEPAGGGQGATGEAPPRAPSKPVLEERPSVERASALASAHAPPLPSPHAPPHAPPQAAGRPAVTIAVPESAQIRSHSTFAASAAPDLVTRAPAYFAFDEGSETRDDAAEPPARPSWEGPNSTQDASEDTFAGEAEGGATFALPFVPRAPGEPPPAIALAPPPRREPDRGEGERGPATERQPDAQPSTRRPVTTMIYNPGQAGSSTLPFHGDGANAARGANAAGGERARPFGATPAHVALANMAPSKPVAAPLATAPFQPPSPPAPPAHGAREALPPVRLSLETFAALVAALSSERADRTGAVLQRFGTDPGAYARELHGWLVRFSQDWQLFGHYFNAVQREMARLRAESR